MTRDDDRSHPMDESGPEAALDEALSALLDDEIEASAADELRARLAREPELAARFERLGEIDGQLRLLGGELPAPDRLSRLHADLRAKLDAQQAVDPGRARIVVLRGRWLAPVGMALAAGLALYLLTGPRPGPGPADAPSIARTDPVPSADGDPLTPFAVSERVEPAPVPDAQAAPAPRPPSADRIARAAARPVAVEEPLAAPAPAPPPAQQVARAEAPVKDASPLASDDPLLAAASDVELAVALEYEVLSDLDVIGNLELLELLGGLDGPEAL